MVTGAIAIGELSRRTGCNIETIRYYERIGVLPKPQRRGSYRTYESADVQRLSFVRRARELGFPIEAVRALLALDSDGSTSCGNARDLAKAHLTDVRTKIADLKRMELVLRRTVEACDTDGIAGCPLLDALGTR